jgi:hypothetical protein
MSERKYCWKAKAWYHEDMIEIDTGVYVTRVTWSEKHE